MRQQSSAASPARQFGARTAVTILLACLPWLVFSSCNTSSAGDEPAGAACVRASECAAGLACVAGRCSADLSALADAASPVPTPPADGGGDDGAMEEGGVPGSDGGGGDSGTPTDGGAPPEAGPDPLDGGGFDAGATDAGPPDAGPPDAGPADAGLSDAGPEDSGMEPPMDAGSDDAGM